MKIKNVKTTVTLAKDFTYTTPGGDTTYRKGTRFNAREMNARGIVIVMGHGMNEIIPREYFGKYTETWDEVVNENGKTVITHHKMDVTKDWNDHWETIVTKENARKLADDRRTLKAKIAHLREIVKYVETGDAKKHLDELLEELKKI